MQINSTGDGLNILIICDYVSHHNWMSYFCWYSINKNLPDAKVFVMCNRNLMQYEDLFAWTKKCNIPLKFCKSADLDTNINLAMQSFVSKPVLVVNPDSVCVRDFDEANINQECFKEINKLDDKFACDCKEERPCCFVTYSKGWGNFNTLSWINKTKVPFFSGIHFNKGILTSNEIRIGQLWNAATPLFRAVIR